MCAIDRGSMNSSKAADGIRHRVFVYGLQNAGPAGLVDGYPCCRIGTSATAASNAELVSLQAVSLITLVD